MYLPFWYSLSQQWDYSKLVSSALLELPGVECKMDFNLASDSFTPTQNPGLSELEISKEQIRIKNMNCSSTPGV